MLISKGVSMSANTQIISNPTAQNNWWDNTITAASFDDILEVFETISYKIEEFKYDAETRTLFGYLAIEAPSNGEPNYPQRVHLYRNGEELPRVKSDENVAMSWPHVNEAGETFMCYIDSTTTPQPIQIRLYPTRKLRDFWFAMFRSVRVESK